MPNTPPRVTPPAARWAALSFSVLAVGLSGCPKTPPKPVTPVEPPKPMAQVRFERIAEDMKRIVGDDDPRLNRDTGVPGGGNAEWSRELTQQLEPPKTEGDNYRGKITITTRYKLTVFTKKNNKKDDKEESGSESNNADPLDPTGEGTDSLGPGMPELPESVGGSLLTADSPIKTMDNEKVRTFQLEYVNDRWKLITKTDPDTEKSIQAAFDYALKRQ